MTQNHNFKRRVRERAAKTGESYTSALRHLGKGPDSGGAPNSIRLAVAQSTGRLDPANAAELRAAGAEARALMQEARRAGARILQFSEGSMCSPDKRIVSSLGPESVGRPTGRAATGICCARKSRRYAGRRGSWACGW